MISCDPDTRVASARAQRLGPKRFLGGLHEELAANGEGILVEVEARAVVGLVEPFYYPHRLEGMEPEERKLREEWIEKNFAIQHQRNLQKEELLRITKGQGRMSWKFNAPYATKRSHIIRIVNERREAKEKLVSGFAKEMKALRQTGEHVTYKALRERVKPPKDSQTTASPELSSSS